MCTKNIKVSQTWKEDGYDGDVDMPGSLDVGAPMIIHENGRRTIIGMFLKQMQGVTVFNQLPQTLSIGSKKMQTGPRKAHAQIQNPPSPPATVGQQTVPLENAETTGLCCVISGTNLVSAQLENFFRWNPSGTFRNIPWYH